METQHQSRNVNNPDKHKPEMKDKKRPEKESNGKKNNKGKSEEFGDEGSKSVKHLLFESIPGHLATLENLDADCTQGLSKAAIVAESEHLAKKLGKLQENLYLARANSVLIVLQGMDTSGKDSTVRRVMTSMNPAGVRIESFKVPTPEEKNHDYLWRIHKVTPERGNISVFNRSHYEDVLVTRVLGMINDQEAKRRFVHINNFEKILCDNRTIVIKIFLHVSKEEQKKRLIERGTSKPWKLEAADWKAHEAFEQYMRLYNDVFHGTSTPDAPWFIIPSDKKWFRDFAIRHLLVTVLERYYEQSWKDEIIKLTQLHPPAPHPTSTPLPSSVALPESPVASVISSSPVSLQPITLSPTSSAAQPHHLNHPHPHPHPHGNPHSLPPPSLTVSPALAKL